jgi:hypothetical protein
VKRLTGKIEFGSLHKRGENLLLVAEHVRDFLKKTKMADEADENRLRRVILPYVEDAIAKASK